MNRLLLLILMTAATLSLKAQGSDEKQHLKDAIVEQLISNDQNDQIVGELARRYFPEGENIDQCLRELVAHELPLQEQVVALMESISSEGTWSDIDYASTARSAWDPLRHLQRTMTLAKAYKAPDSRFYTDKEVLSAALAALTYWIETGLKCPNWWYNEIGAPKVIAPLLLLLEEEISPDLMARGVEMLQISEIDMTGQNRVWLSGVVFMRSLLSGDDALLEASSKAIRDELKLAKEGEEGIQPDYSFHQHGTQLQFGNYGLAFAASISYWMRIFDETSYDFTAEQKGYMSNYMLKGLATTVWGGAMDVSSCGRQLFVNSMRGKASSLLISCLNMMKVDRAHADQYRAYITRNFVKPYTNNLVGNFAFNDSKYTMHRAQDFAFSVKMCSPTVIGGETTNRENLKGYHLADGATMIYVDGWEYHDIFGVWDGRFIPGTTVAVNDKPLPIIYKSTYRNGSDFVGSVSYGDIGIAAMELRRDGVSANKGWFFFEDVVLCTGNSIESSEGEPTTTVVNQANFRYSLHYKTPNGKVAEAQKGESYKATRIVCDKIGYESLDGQPIAFRAGEQVGRWSDVAHFYSEEEVRGDIFMARIDHAAQGAQSYAYGVKPAVKFNVFLKGNSIGARYRVIQNDEVATVVESIKSGVVLAIFWQRVPQGCGAFAAYRDIEPSVAIARPTSEDTYEVEFTQIR